MSRSFGDLVTTLERRRDRTAHQVIRVERVVVEVRASERKSLRERLGNLAAAA
jgi:hypothetical protein